MNQPPRLPPSNAMPQPPSIGGTAVGPVPVAPLGYFAPAIGPSSGGVWREKNVVIVARGAVLPDRCVKCNCETDLKRVRKKLTYSQPGYVFLGALIALLLQKSMRIDMAVCGKHRSIRWRNILISWCCVLIGIGGAIGSAGLQSGALAIISGAVFVFGLVWAVVATSLLKPKKIDDHYAWLNGAGREFLESLPDVSTAPPY